MHPITCAEGPAADVLAVLPDLFVESDGYARGSFVRILEDTGGQGICDWVARELRALLGEGHVTWICLNDCSRGIKHIENMTAELGRYIEGPLPARYPYFHMDDNGEYSRDAAGELVPANDHCVLFYRGWMVDLTARQFDKRLPFPFIWRPVPAASET